MKQSVLSTNIAAKHNEAAAIVAQLSLREKAAFASGASFWTLEACERLGVPSVMVTDGPHGLRKQQGSGDHVGLNASVPATCFPTASALAASWDPGLLAEIGVALGEQCVAENVAVLLGPGMNIKRHPLCGRNFEYFSEDPLLTGEMAAALVQGIQSQGVGACLKHFAANNQENGRMVIDVVVDERTLRELYLRGFEIAVERARPWTLMCAYNRLNGSYCSEHDWLLNQVLRREWGFQGLVMTDWGATNDRVRGIAAGLDLEMPTSGGVNDLRLERAVKDGRLPDSTLDQAIVRNIGLALCGAEQAERNVALDRQAHHLLARRAATVCMVLLKNDGALLPLAPRGRLGVIGAFAKQPRYQGAGSSQVTPTQLDCAYDAICEAVGGAGEVVYAPGYDPVHAPEDEALIQEATEVAGRVEVAVVFAGLPGAYESEGFDRDHMRMPAQHDRLVAAVSQANPNTIVVLANGSPVAMPWIDRVGAVLECYLAGQAGGGALADVLFGTANPSGKLAETFPVAQEDVAADRWFPGEGRQVQYREGLHVGYRYFDSAAVPVLFPFGHGLSYTSFAYTDLTATVRGDRCDVEVKVTNTGAVKGAEVVQLYVHDVESSMYRPEQELKAFSKVTLEPGESKTVAMELDRSAFAVFDREAQRWVVEAGTFEVRVGSSSRDIRLAAGIEMPSADSVSSALTAAGPRMVDGSLQVSSATFEAMLGETVPAPEPGRPFHVNSTLREIEATWLGARLKSRIEKGFLKNLGIDGNADPSLEKMFREMLNTMPLRVFAIFSRGKVSIRHVRALVALLNGEFVQFVRALTGRETSW